MALRAAILKAELAKHSVRWVSFLSQGGDRMRQVTDVAKNRGIQRVTVSKGDKTGHETTLLLRSTAYLRGDAFALRDLGLSASQAARYAGKWISFHHGSTSYALLGTDLTVGSILMDDVARTHLSLVSGTVGGKAMRGLRGTSDQGGTITTYIRKSGPPLPVEVIEVEHHAHARSGHSTFSRWNEPVHVSAPAHSTPFG
jgi:hypothetical protein